MISGKQDSSFPDHALALRLEEREQVGVDRGRFGGGHAVREALVGLERPFFQQLCRQWPRSHVGNDRLGQAFQCLLVVGGSEKSIDRRRPPIVRTVRSRPTDGDPQTGPINASL